MGVIEINSNHIKDDDLKRRAINEAFFYVPNKKRITAKWNATGREIFTSTLVVTWLSNHLPTFSYHPSRSGICKTRPPHCFLDQHLSFRIIYHYQALLAILLLSSTQAPFSPFSVLSRHQWQHQALPGLASFFPSDEANNKLMQSFEALLLSSAADKVWSAFVSFLSRKRANRVTSRSSFRSSGIMGLFGLMLHFLAFVIMMIFQKLADEIMFTIEDCEVYNMIVKVRSFKHYPWPDPSLRSGWLTKDIFSFSPYALAISISGRRLRPLASITICVGLPTSFLLLPSSQSTSGPVCKYC